MRPVDNRDDERRLDDTLAALRRAESQVETPAHVEGAVMAAWEPPSSVGAATRSPSVGAAFRRPWKYAAVAAGVLLTVTLGRLGVELRDAGVVPAGADAPQLLLVGQPILEGEAVRIVRMRMPAATLSGLGVRTTASDPADAVDVDVVIGEDGVARAIRF